MQKNVIKKQTERAHKGVNRILILLSSYRGSNEYIGDSLSKNAGDSFLIIHCSKSNSATLRHSKAFAALAQAGAKQPSVRPFGSARMSQARPLTVVPLFRPVSQQLAGRAASQPVRPKVLNPATSPGERPLKAGRLQPVQAVYHPWPGS